MNVSQALEYERQPFIPMFIYGDHGAMESERQKGEEALKVLETEYFTAEGDPGFDFATVRASGRAAVYIRAFSSL